MRGPFLALAIALAAGPLAALELDLPATAQLQAQEERPAESVPIATGPWTPSTGPTLAQPAGTIRTEAFRIGGATLTTLQILSPLAAQIEAAGWEVLYTCETRTCGGFDFRHALDVLPAPEMHVSLGDYRYLSARDGDDWLAILVSRAAGAAHIQVTRVSPEGAPPPPVSTTAVPVAPPPGDFAAALERDGRVVLSDLVFATGSAQLGPGDFASLRALADYLAARPSRTVALVGHTDARGALEGNVALSRQRAQSVVDRLVSDHGVARARLRAEGMGYLAPLTTNLTPEGREANRRVEVILTSPD
ncbi:OmpA family protein [Histidinibacterium lentulum]|nr:OmpA family protein [Histidinibacterium lentulum]